jgi:serine phosphatase RsbU (regulator of sigma subunit)
LPDIEGVDIAVNYAAAGLTNEVGGDFYDVFAIDARRWALVIGDVCGKGPEAAAVTSVARHTIRAAASHGAGHCEVLEWINDALQDRPDATFVTALYATLEQVDASWRCTLVSGGHPLPVLVRADGTSSLVGVHGTLLGILAEVSTEPVVVELRPGDTLVLYTDGLTDLPPPHGLDDERVRRVVEQAAGASDAPSVIRSLGEQIESLLPIEQRHDDLALMVVRIPGRH